MLTVEVADRIGNEWRQIRGKIKEERVKLLVRYFITYPLTTPVCFKSFMIGIRELVLVSISL